MLSSKSIPMSTPLLSVNKLIFCSGGVLGRIDYLLCLLKLVLHFLGGAVIVWMITTGLTLIHPSFTHLISVYAVVGLILLAYFKYINSFKRIRDIRGLTLNENLWKTGYIIVSVIPIVNLIAMLCLFFIPGEVTKSKVLV